MSALPRLDPGARSAIWGVSGSGKSTIARAVAANWAAQRRVIVIDPAAASVAPLPRSKGPGLTVTAPATPHHCTDVLLWSYLHSDPARPVTVICDEAPFYLRDPSDAVLKVFFQGRHRGLGVLLVGQRPSAVAPSVRSQVTTTLWMRMTDRADLNIVAASSRDLAAALPKLKTGEWKQWV